MFLDEETQGVRRSGLVEWYLREIEGDIDSEAELIERKTIVEKVIDRLVLHVCILINGIFISKYEGLPAK